MSVSCECYVFSGVGLGVGPIARPEESYRVCVIERDRESSIMRRPWPTRGFCAIIKYVNCGCVPFIKYSVNKMGRSLYSLA